MELTTEQIAKSVAAAYDSVAIINELKVKVSPTADETATLNRNKQHLTVMLAKDWFFEALTTEQKAELNALKA